MGFLGLPGKAELSKRALIFAIDTLNDAIDTPDKRDKIAKIINAEIDMPGLTEPEEEVAIEVILDKLNFYLQKFERAVRDKK